MKKVYSFVLFGLLISVNITFAMEEPVGVLPDLTKRAKLLKKAQTVDETSRFNIAAGGYKKRAASLDFSPIPDADAALKEWRSIRDSLNKQLVNPDNAKTKEYIFRLTDILYSTLHAKAVGALQLDEKSLSSITRSLLSKLERNDYEKLTEEEQNGSNTLFKFTEIIPTLYRPIPIDHLISYIEQVKKGLLSKLSTEKDPDEQQKILGKAIEDLASISSTSY